MTKQTYIKIGTVWKACTNVWVNVPTAAIGDSRQGGKVAYIGSAGDFEHGMISATANTSTGYQWGCESTRISGFAESGTGIGFGARATAAIVAGCSTDSAAKLCDNLSLNGYTDWFLPSIDELNELYQNKTTIGGFSTDWHWSSNEYYEYLGYRKNFLNGSVDNNYKNYSYAHVVRAVRSASTLSGWIPKSIPHINISGVWKECMEYLPAIGDDHEGGKVAYLGSEGDFVNGMISTTADTSAGYQWGCVNTNIAGDAAGTAIGTGQKATAAIVAGCSTDSAAKLCDNLSLNGYTDWFLPSIDELNELYQNKTTIGGFSAASYWSSSEHMYYYYGFYSQGKAQHFSNGGIANYAKDGNLRVRAVRGF